jgi:hypothetical protein
MNAKRTARIVTAALSLLAALGLLAAGCRQGRDPVSPEVQLCIHCIGRKCAGDVQVCDADPAPSSSHDGNLCGCLNGARILGLTLAESRTHCGNPDAPYKALESCVDDVCAARCPLQLKD